MEFLYRKGSSHIPTAGMWIVPCGSSGGLRCAQTDIQAHVRYHRASVRAVHGARWNCKGQGSIDWSDPERGPTPHLRWSNSSCRS